MHSSTVGVAVTLPRSRETSTPHREKPVHGPAAEIRPTKKILVDPLNTPPHDCGPSPTAPPIISWTALIRAGPRALASTSIGPHPRLQGDRRHRPWGAQVARDAKIAAYRRRRAAHDRRGGSWPSPAASRPAGCRPLLRPRAAALLPSGCAVGRGGRPGRAPSGSVVRGRAAGSVGSGSGSVGSPSGSCPIIRDRRRRPIVITDDRRSGGTGSVGVGPCGPWAPTPPTVRLHDVGEAEAARLERPTIARPSTSRSRRLRPTPEHRDLRADGAAPLRELRPHRGQPADVLAAISVLARLQTRVTYAPTPRSTVPQRRQQRRAAGGWQPQRRAHGHGLGACADLTNINLDGANFDNASLNRCDLTGASLRGTILRTGALPHSTLHDADLGGADLGTVTCEETEFTGPSCAAPTSATRT